MEEASNNAKENVVMFPSASKIVIEYNNGQATSAFYKFRISKLQSLFARKGKPQYILIGTDSSSFLGDSLTELGYYLTQEEAQKELKAIKIAMENGQPSYQLQYACDVKPGWISFIS